MAEKQCTKCKCVKPHEDFPKKASRPDGLNQWCRACFKANYETKRQVYIDRAADWSRANPEKRAAIRKKWADENRELINRMVSDWSKRNRDKKNEGWRQYRARKLGAEGNHTIDDVRALLELQRGRCTCCGKKMEKFHVDHIVPLSRGGSNGKENIQLLCPTCNCGKGAKDPIKFMQERGRLL
jgi:5-methylcytosine-specific restriction endonuclease McrA